MTTLTFLDAATPTLRDPDAHARRGFELGWDYAHYRLTPPAPYAQAPSALHDGLRAGRATFGLRTLEANRHVRKWLQLRLHAWLRGRSVEAVQVTPNYLAQIDVPFCPVTRVALTCATLEGSDASVDRVRNDAGYAAGNLVVMSTKANRAKGAGGRAEALAALARLEADGLSGVDGLDRDAWQRLAVLCSFVEPMPHAEACGIPLRVLPPNRLRLFNPAQALQAFVSRQLLAPGWSQRVSRIEALLPGKALRRDFKQFFIALLPRVLEGGAARVGDAQAGRRAGPLPSQARTLPEGGAAAGRTGCCRLRWAVEDAWRAPLVMQRWQAFALQLTPEQCEALVAKASAKRLGVGAVVALPEAAATDGWNLATGGYEADEDMPDAAARAPRRGGVAVRRAARARDVMAAGAARHAQQQSLAW